MRRVIWSLFVLVFLLMASSCGGKPEDRAGTWEGTSDYGNFTFRIDETGTKITYIEYDLKNEDGATADIFDMPGSKAVKMSDGRFSLRTYLFANVPAVQWEGTFNARGTKAEGTLWLFGWSDKATEWTATKVE